MSLNLLPSIHPKTSCGITLQEPSHHAACLGRHVWGEVERVGEDALIHGVDVLVVEGWEASLKITCVGSGKLEEKLQGEG